MVDVRHSGSPKPEGQAVARPPATLTRVGRLLLVASGVAAIALVVLALTGAPVGLGGPDVHQEWVIVALSLLAFGLVALAAGGDRPFEGRAVRISAGLLAAGLVCMAGAGVAAARLTSDPLEDWPTIVLSVLGVAGIVVGAIALSLTLVRRLAPVP